MVSGKGWVARILVASLVGLPAFAFAAEHGGQEHAGAGTAREHGSSAGPSPAPAAQPERTSAPAAPIETAPAPEVPVLKPILITFSGDLTALNTQASPAMITVQDRYGVKKEISVPSEAKIAQGAVSRALPELKVGDKLTVEYTYDVATGQRTAQAISVGESAPAAAGQ